MSYEPGFRRVLPIVFLAGAMTTGAGAGQSGYQDLVALFTDWLAFETPPMKDGAPDYTAATMVRKQSELKAFQVRLARIDPMARVAAGGL
jgi:hypothetical protein